MNNQESKIERKMNIQGALYVIHIGGEMNDKSDASYDALFRSYEGANKRIKELEETCACLRLTISKLESLLTQAGLDVAELQAEIARLWQIAYNGEYSKARNWGADHEQADTYALRVAGESSLEDIIRKAKEE